MVQLRRVLVLLQRPETVEHPPRARALPLLQVVEVHQLPAAVRQQLLVLAARRQPVMAVLRPLVVVERLHRKAAHLQLPEAVAPQLLAKTRKVQGGKDAKYIAEYRCHHHDLSLLQ